MKNKTILMQTAVICALFAGPVVGQDFQRSYTLVAGSEVSIRNVAGDIRVAGYDGPNIIVSATKEGRDRNQIEIVDASDDNAVKIYVVYLRNHTDASVNFEVQVPRNVQYDYDEISSVSGNVTVSAIAGQLNVHSVSGSIQLEDVLGSATAGSISGDVYARISQPLGKWSLKFTSISGDVSVHAPPDLDAYVDMSTISGSLWTDFPIRISGRWPFWGRSAHGRLEHGTASLKLSSISGRVCLLVNH